MKAPVFISYASEDSGAAQRLAALLAERDLEVWIDRAGIEPGDGFVRAIEEALGRARTVLVLWSRSAAASRWVQQERDSAVAMKLGGANLEVILARLDREKPPPLSSSEQFVDLTTEEGWRREVPRLFELDRDESDRESAQQRLIKAEVRRGEELAKVVSRLRGGQPVVVLAPRKMGSTSFTRQLQAHLREAEPRWRVPAVPVQPLADESIADYLARMRELLGLGTPGGRIVAIVFGWSRGDIEGAHEKLDAYHAALGAELRALAEGGRGGHRFSLVAIGGYPLYLLRYGPAEMSLLNSAMQVDLSDLPVDRVHELMEEVSPGTWSRQDAGEVWRRGGGHPLLMKKVIRAWLEEPEQGWAGAEKALEEDHDFLIPRMSQAAAEPRLRRALAHCSQSDDGIPLQRFQPMAPGNYLLYEGLLRRDGRRLKLRCGAVRRLVGEMLEDGGDEADV